MSLLASYLNSPAMAQQVLATGDGTTPDEVKFATNQLTYAAIRWHQLFENPNVDAQRIKMQPLKHSDFMLFMEAATDCLKKPNVTADYFHEQVNDLLRAASFKAFGLSPEQITDPQVSQDYHQRLVTLLTMGACEFLGCNAYFADSIREHGLDPHLKLYDFDKYWQKFANNKLPKMVIMPYFRDREQLNEQIELSQQYLQQWGPEKTVQDLLHGDCYDCYEHAYDDKIDLTNAEMIDVPTPYSISHQITCSQVNAQARELSR